MHARLLEDYRIAWICALPKELTAARAMLDEEHEGLPTIIAHDNNTYVLGDIHNHNVVIACLPAGVYGTNSAAVVVTNLLRTFTNVRMGLMVGIGGGIPDLDRGVDIRLGDVVVSQPGLTHGGVVQYDLRKNLGGNVFERKGILNRPPSTLLGAVSRLQSNHQMNKNLMVEIMSQVQHRLPSLVKAGFTCPDTALDVLHCSRSDRHDTMETCSQCTDRVIYRKPRSHQAPEIHYGTIASGNELIKNASERDRLGRELGAICVEMEAAGFLNELPCLVVRGICDYADHNKNDIWQEYAAMTASAYAKELLSCLPLAQTPGDNKTSHATRVRVSQRFPFPRNDDFVIRTHIFAKLEQLLPPHPQAQSAVLWGLGGSGKTQIALEFAYRRHHDQGYAVFWVHASSQSQFLEAYRQIAADAGIPSTVQGVELLKAVRQWLESQTDWLLVIDNADDLSLFGLHQPGAANDSATDLYPFIPRGSNGSILWTTRDEKAVGHLVGTSRGVNVKDMTFDEARELLTGLSGITETDDTTKAISAILERLDCLPLAVSQAAAFIRARNVSCQDYLIRLGRERKRWRILEEDGSKLHRAEGVPNNVMQTWQVTVDLLKYTYPLAYWILQVMVYFHNQHIPWSLVKTVGLQRLQEVREQTKCHDHNSERVELSDEDDSDFEEDEVRSAVGRLTQFSLVRVGSDSNEGLHSYNIHKLVQDATRSAIWRDNKNLGQLSAKLPSTAALNALSQIFPSGEFGTWNACANLLAHVLTVRKLPELAERKPELRGVLGRTFRYLKEQRRWVEAEDVLTELISLDENVLGRKHPDVLLNKGELAWVYFSQSRYTEAEQIGVEVLELQKEVLGERHPHIIDSMGDLGTTYLRQGRLWQAEDLTAESWELSKTLLGEKHVNTMRCMANLAVVYYEQYRFSDAEAMQLKVLEMQMELLGEKHPETITTMGHLGLTYTSQGRMDQAEEILAKVLKLRKEVIGEKHADTLAGMSSLAFVYRRQGRLGEAEELAAKILEYEQAVSGEYKIYWV